MQGSIFKVVRSLYVAGRGTVVMVEVQTLGSSRAPFRVAWNHEDIPHIGIVIAVDARPSSLLEPDRDPAMFHPGQELALTVNGHRPTSFPPGTALYGE